jgi:ABC-2 type transport system permease protein
MSSSVALALGRAEFIKLRSTRTALGLLIAALAFSVIPAILVMVFLPEDSMRKDGAALAALASLSVVPTLALVFGMLGMTNEYRHGTITYAYLDTPKRWMVIAVKLVCYGLVGAGVMVVAGAIVALIIYVGAAIRGVTLALGPGSSLDGVVTLQNVALFLVTVGLMTAFGVGLGALFRAQVPTVAGVLVWALIVEPIVTALKPTIGKFLPFTAFNQLNFSGQASGPDNPVADMLTRPQAFLVSVAYIAAVSVAAVYISLRRDVT